MCENSSRGQLCEELVLKDLLKKNWNLIGEREKWAGVELDLILKKSHYKILEVKSIRHFDEVSFRVHPKQIQRLLFARETLQEAKQSLVELEFAFVCGEKILYLPVESFLQD